MPLVRPIRFVATAISILLVVCCGMARLAYSCSETVVDYLRDLAKQSEGRMFEEAGKTGQVIAEHAFSNELAGERIANVAALDGYKFVPESKTMLADLIGAGIEIRVNNTNKAGFEITKDGQPVITVPESITPDIVVHERAHYEHWIELTQQIRTRDGLDAIAAARQAYAVMRTPQGVAVTEAKALSAQIEALRAKGSMPETLGEWIGIANYPAFNALEWIFRWGAVNANYEGKTADNFNQQLDKLAITTADQLVERTIRVREEMGANSRPNYPGDYFGYAITKELSLSPFGGSIEKSVKQAIDRYIARTGKTFQPSFKEVFREALVEAGRQMRERDRQELVEYLRPYDAANSRVALELAKTLARDNATGWRFSEAWKQFMAQNEKYSKATTRLEQLKQSDGDLAKEFVDSERPVTDSIKIIDQVYEYCDRNWQQIADRLIQTRPDLKVERDQFDPNVTYVTNSMAKLYVPLFNRPGFKIEPKPFQDMVDLIALQIPKRNR